MTTQYIVILARITGGNSRPFETVYSADGPGFPYRQQAIDHGLVAADSDDFNIGVIRDGKLVSLDWMDRPVDTDPSVLSSVAKQICI